MKGGKNQKRRKKLLEKKPQSFGKSTDTQEIEKIKTPKMEPVHSSFRTYSILLRDNTQTPDSEGATDLNTDSGQRKGRQHTPLSQTHHKKKGKKKERCADRGACHTRDPPRLALVVSILPTLSPWSLQAVSIPPDYGADFDGAVMEPAPMEYTVWSIAEP